MDLPDPGAARTLDELVGRLRSLKVWAGDPSYEAITDRVNAMWTAAGRPAGELARRGTVVDCFKLGRRRMNTDLVIAVAEALHPDPGYVAQWGQALRVVSGEAQAAVQVRAHDRLPDDLAEFTGRTVEVDRLRRALRRGGAEAGGAVVIAAIEGLAGVGKTRLAVHAGHLLSRDRPVEQVLFVDLRGFHPDPAQPPADPAAVLDSFLRLLGVPGQQIPHDVAARAAMYRQRLAGRHALVVLDNAADEAQVRPLLPDDPRCLTVITSRRGLPGLNPVTRLAVDVFTPEEAVEFLERAAPGVPIGDDPDALLRVARRCGHLPLALSLVAGQMRAKPGWTVTDHADRLDERHRTGRLDSGVELALSLSYQHLPADRRRLSRLLALHPGDDFDAYAAAALAGTDLDTTRAHLCHLCAEHLLQPAGADRYRFHDLVRLYAGDRVGDEERPPERRAALTRLFDQYAYTAATAMDTLYPAERHRRPRIPEPAVPTAPVGDPTAARAWLDAERTNLVASAAHAERGWPGHAVTLAATLWRYLETGGYFGDAIALHTHAAGAAHHSGDAEAEARALTDLGTVEWWLGHYARAAEHQRQALRLFRKIGDRSGEARALGNLGGVHWCLGRYRQAADCHRQALAPFREVGDRIGEAHTLGNLGLVYFRLGRYEQAFEQHQLALALCRDIGDRTGEARALTNLGLVYERLGRCQEATEYHAGALDLFRETGDRLGEAVATTNGGLVYQRLGQHRLAADRHRQALGVYREVGEPNGEVETLISLGAALCAGGRPVEAREQLTAALALADEIGERYEQARGHDGLAYTHQATGEPDLARHHWRRALDLYTELDVPEADEVRAHLAALEAPAAGPDRT